MQVTRPGERPAYGAGRAGARCRRALPVAHPAQAWLQHRIDSSRNGKA